MGAWQIGCKLFGALDSILCAGQTLTEEETERASIGWTRSSSTCWCRDSSIVLSPTDLVPYRMLQGLTVGLPYKDRSHSDQEYAFVSGKWVQRD